MAKKRKTAVMTPPELCSLLESNGIDFQWQGLSDPKDTELSGISTPENANSNEMCVLHRSESTLVANVMSRSCPLLVAPTSARKTVAQLQQQYSDTYAVLTDDTRRILALLLPHFFELEPPSPRFSAATERADREGFIASPGAMLGDDVEIGAGTMLFPGVVIYPRVKIGRNSILHSGVVVREDCSIGDGVIIGANTTIGSEGFGYVPDPKCVLRAVPQVGAVRIADHVEIGANSSIDRGTLGDTEIGVGVKIDNQVQIGHNVSIGAYSIVCAGVGIAGSARIGAGVTLAGKVGIADHVSIVDGVRIGGMSGVTSDIHERGDYAGYPLLSARVFRRYHASLESMIEANTEWRKQRRGSK